MTVVLGALALATPAQASTLVYFCDFDICAVEADGSRHRNLTSKLSGDFVAPQLSHDGRLLVYVKDGDLYAADGRARNRRAFIPAQPNYAGSGVGSPVLRHDAKEVLYVRGLGLGGGSQICRVATRPGATPRCGTGTNGRRYFTWGPGGTILSINAENDEICVTSINGGCKRVIVRIESHLSFYQEPALSPDGRLIAANVQRADADESRIALFDVRTGRHLRDLTKGGDYVELPDFSPDGRRVAFSSYDDGWHICTVGIGGGKVRCPVRDIHWSGGPRTNGPSWGG